jgi:8-oxo-dGTP diphosphatase
MEIGIIVHTVIKNKEDKILLIKRASHVEALPNLWDIPGGTLEDGEDPVKGAIREVAEETGLVIDSPSLCAYTSNIDKDKNKHFIRLIFHIKIEPNSITIDPNEHSEYAWINKADINTFPVVYYLPDAIEKLDKL